MIYYVTYSGSLINGTGTATGRMRVMMNEPLDTMKAIKKVEAYISEQSPELSNVWLMWWTPLADSSLTDS